MTVAEAQELFAYDEWANVRLFDALGSLGPEQLVAAAPSSFGSLRETAAHIVAAEWIWLRRWLGDSPTSPPAWAAVDALPALRQRLAEVVSERTALLAQMTDADLETRLHYRNLKGEGFRHKRGDVMRHLVNHSTYHRGQAATQLRQLGLTPPNTDLVGYLRERE
jgi:uncharacterized damage-inducible protein DinB